MQKKENRRTFLGQLGAGVLSGGVLSQVTGNRAPGGPRAPSGMPARMLDLPPTTVAWAPPPVLTNPNILLIMLDQMRSPQGLNAAQLNLLNTTFLPNIFGKIRNNSYVLQDYYAAATPCVSARASLMTGLYSPQTAVFTNDGPSLSTRFPTWGSAIRVFNTAYQNVWWFGKWHLSDKSGTGPSPLLPYGFQTGLYPGGRLINPITGLAYYVPSPNGSLNEGVNGGVCAAGQHDQGVTYPSDAMIAGDVINWLQGQAGYRAPSSPWCATVSLNNPHDIAGAPGGFVNPAAMNTPSWFPSDFPDYPPTPPQGVPAALCTVGPANWENLLDPDGADYVGNIKPSWQSKFCEMINEQHGGAVPSWPAFLNEYYWLQYYVDQVVGSVLTALSQSPFASNTIVIFVSDHGEFGGSHGLHDKAGAVYQESIHVPLYVQFPGQTGAISMTQMCSSVDIFGLMCDLATGGSGSWKTSYPDLVNRESIWNYLYRNAAEQSRLISIGGAAATPFILHTVDEIRTDEFCPPGPSPPPDNRHIIGFRTKTQGKLGFYCHWAPNTTCWDQVTNPEYEFYNYSTITGLMETGNAYTTDLLAPQYVAALGHWGPAPWGAGGTGIIGTELDPPLSSTLQPVQAAAQHGFVAYSNPCDA